MKIYLVGYMGTGKSYLGKLLAERLGYAYYDTDSIIESKQNKSISTIFSHEGEEAFRIYEKEVIRNFKKEDAVISCGGGLPCFHDNMDYMLNSGMVIWIKSSIRNIIERVSDDDSRPLLKMDKSELESHVKNHLKSRKPYYSRSHIKVWNRGPAMGTLNRMVTYLRYLDSTIH